MRQRPIVPKRKNLTALTNGSGESIANGETGVMQGDRSLQGLAVPKSAAGSNRFDSGLTEDRILIFWPKIRELYSRRAMCWDPTVTRKRALRPTATRRAALSPYQTRGK